MKNLFLRIYIYVTMPHLSSTSTGSRDSGQATSEYALVMLAAALIALLAVAWATGGGGAGKIGRLFDQVISNVISKLP